MKQFKVSLPKCHPYCCLGCYSKRHGLCSVDLEEHLAGAKELIYLGEINELFEGDAIVPTRVMKYLTGEKISVYIVKRFKK